MNSDRVDSAFNPKVMSICGLDIQSSFDFGITNCGVGGRIWKSAIAFCSFITKYNINFSNKSIIELGAGTGLCGMAIAQYNPGKVLITDYDPGCIETIKQNVILNKEKVKVNAIETDILNFGNEEQLNIIQQKYPEGFDYVIGTDLIYAEKVIEFLITGIDKLSYKKGCQIILVLNNIFPEVEIFIKNLLKTGKFCVREFNAEEMDEMFYKITIFFIQVKKEFIKDN